MKSKVFFVISFCLSTTLSTIAMAGCLEGLNVNTLEVVAVEDYNTCDIDEIKSIHTSIPNQLKALTQKVGNEARRPRPPILGLSDPSIRSSDLATIAALRSTLPIVERTILTKEPWRK